MLARSPVPSDGSALGYVLALLIFGLSLGLRLLLFPHGAHYAFATFYPAVIATLYVCGVKPGLMVIALGSVAGGYLLRAAGEDLHLGGLGLVLLAAYLSTSLLLAWVVRRLRQVSAGLAQAQAQAEDSRRALKAVVDDQTDMLFRFDGDGRVVFANPIARQTFDLVDEDLRRKTWHLMVQPQDREAVAALLATLRPQSPIVSTETAFHDRAGELRWGEFVHRALFDGKGRLSSMQTTVRDVTERRRLKAQLKDLGERLQDLYDKAPCGYFSLDATGTFRQLNAVMASWLGQPAEALLGRHCLREFLSPEGQQAVNEHFPLLMRTGRCGPLEMDLLRPGSPPRRVIVSATAAQDEAGAFLHSRTVMYDISELAVARQQLAQVASDQERMLDNDLIGILRLRGRTIVWCNRASERMFGYPASELVGSTSRLLYASDADYLAFGQTAYEVLQKGEKYRAQLQLRRRDGSPIWVDVNGLMLSAEGPESLWMSLDITAMKERQQQIERVAFHDALTGLPNRLLMMDRLRQMVLLSRRTHEPLAVAFFDLDGFKAVNDGHGHAAGDELLGVVAQRLQAGIRAHDTAARVGGDEFVLLLPCQDGRAEAEQVVQRLTGSLIQPVTLASGASVQVGVSVGLALCPDDGLDVDRLLVQADQAMYQKKARHKAELQRGLDPSALI